MKIQENMRCICKKASNTMNAAYIKMQSFMQEERGDTNFISILVALGIALALAAVFLVFKDQVLGWVDSNIAPFFSSNGGR